MGPEYIALALTAVISAVSSGTWAASKILGRQEEKRIQTVNYVKSQEKRLDTLEAHLNRMPLEYVLKVDFLREIKEMHDNFREINNKLDKLVEKLLSK